MKETSYKRPGQLAQKYLPRQVIKPPVKRKAEELFYGDRQGKRPSIHKTSMEKPDYRYCLRCGKKGHLAIVCYASFWCDIKSSWGQNLQQIAKSLRENAKVYIKYEQPIPAWEKRVVLILATRIIHEFRNSPPHNNDEVGTVIKPIVSPNTVQKSPDFPSIQDIENYKGIMLPTYKIYTGDTRREDRTDATRFTAWYQAAVSTKHSGD